MRPTAVTLDDKYTAHHGRVLLSGIQALVRLVLEQRRLDTARSLSTRAFVSGYPGSPLAGLDQEMARAAQFLDADGVEFRPGLNEELAATAVAGTQLLRQAPGRRHDGVTGFWYGKNPGLDRAADAIRHGTLAGTSALGGAVALIGDDPGCKSSTVPSSCEQTAQSLGLPLLAPGSVAEVVELGLHAVALSRACGLWTGLKIIADVADSSATVDVSGLHQGVPAPGRAEAAPVMLLGSAALDAEHDALTRRLDLARAYARATRLNRVDFGAPRARLGVLASGTTAAVVRRALDDLGLDEPAMEALGLRISTLAMPFPADADTLVELTDGLEEVLVVEDKFSFVEQQLKAAHYGRPGAPRILGRHGPRGDELLSARAALGAEDVARALAARIGPDRLPRTGATHLAAMAPRRPSRIPLPTVAARTPFFCSGCPHNTSTRTGDDTLVGVGIGCHAMVALDDSGRGHQLGLTQMGGEGAQWLGLAPFTDDRNFVQNLGDGTFHHSGSLAIRAAVAAGESMTYKLLYNDAVAMTGGQRPQGRLDVPALTRWLAVEGVRRVVVTTADPGSYRGVLLDDIASVRHRDELAEVERELAGVDGVTVLIHDDRCAAEERRMRKRGTLPRPTERVVINERVCEGCGDCGEVSTCLSVQPVETEFGRKTRIHQASCNTDLSCLGGDCPSFLLVTPSADGERSHRPVPEPPAELPEPVHRVTDDSVLLRMPGIGGTGVVTVSQILQMAAHLDGRCAAGLEQIGMAQKGGPVVSDVRIAKQPVRGALRATRGTADVLIGFDLLGAASEDTLAAARAGHTVAVVSSAVVPTAAMVTGRVAVPGSPDDALERIGAATDADTTLHVDAHGLAETLFADHMPANMLLVGAAFQHGCVPLSAEAIEQAIRLNGAAVETTLAAFRWGRATVADTAAVTAAVATATGTAGTTGAPARSEGLAEVLATRVDDLTGYQDRRYADRYAEEVQRVTAIATERAGAEAGERIGVAYATGLHKLMAYKDEYEVARLHLDPAEQARRDAEFGPDATVSVLLHPPVLRAMGMNRKIRLRRSAGPVFRALRAARRLRGTALDPFGRAEVRRVERALVGEYQQLVRDALAHLHTGTVDAVAAIAGLPDLVRGYEEIKLRNIAQFRERAAAALAQLADG